MNEERTNVVTLRVYKWTGMCVCPRASKISFLTHFILQSLLSSLPFCLLFPWLYFILHNSFLHLTLTLLCLFLSLPISVLPHLCFPSCSFTRHLLLLSQYLSLFSLLSPHPFHSGDSASPKTTLTWVASTAFGSGTGMAAKRRCFIASWLCRQKYLTEMAVYTCHLGQNQS